MINTTEIVEMLPYTEPFLFVDKLIAVSDNGAAGIYTYKENEYFYKGHFKDKPITPGVILTETMAQIGLVCLGIYLFSKEDKAAKPVFVLSDTAIDFYKPIFPGETVIVISEKVYYRFQKLRCKVLMKNSKDEIVCKGTISGMIVKNEINFDVN